MDFALSIMEQGLIYGILALGVYITYKILDFPDLTVDGSFPLGSAVTAALLTKGVNPYLSLLIASGRNLYGTDPCKRKGQGSSFRNYYDDRSVYSKSYDRRKQ